MQAVNQFGNQVTGLPGFGYVSDFYTDKMSEYGPEKFTRDPFYEKILKEGAKKGSQEEDDYDQIKRRPPQYITEKQRKLWKKIMQKAWYHDRNFCGCMALDCGCGMVSLISSIPLLGSIIAYKMHYNMIKLCHQAGCPAKILTAMGGNATLDFAMTLVPLLGVLLSWMKASSTRNAGLFDDWLRGESYKQQMVMEKQNNRHNQLQKPAAAATSAPSKTSRPGQAAAAPGTSAAYQQQKAQQQKAQQQKGQQQKAQQQQQQQRAQAQIHRKPVSSQSPAASSPRASTSPTSAPTSTGSSVPPPLTSSTSPSSSVPTSGVMPGSAIDPVTGSAAGSSPGSPISAAPIPPAHTAPRSASPAGVPPVPKAVPVNDLDTHPKRKPVGASYTPSPPAQSVASPPRSAAASPPRSAVASPPRSAAASPPRSATASPPRGVSSPAAYAAAQSARSRSQSPGRVPPPAGTYTRPPPPSAVSASQRAVPAGFTRPPQTGMPQQQSPLQTRAPQGKAPQG